MKETWGREGEKVEGRKEGEEEEGRLKKGRRKNGERGKAAAYIWCDRVI